MIANPNSNPAQPDWVYKRPTDPKLIIQIIKENRQYLKEQSPRGRALRLMLEQIDEKYEEAKQVSKRSNPLAYIEPSYEQALILNAWVWGFSFICIFSANRIGKTFAQILDKLLWIFPNDLRYRMFKGFICNDCKKYIRLIPRHDISDIKRIQQFFDANPNLKPDKYKQPYESPNLPIFNRLKQEFPDIFETTPPNDESPWGKKDGVIWQGAQDHETHKNTIFPIWRSLLPSKSILQDNITDRTLSFQPIPNSSTKWTLVGKSYESSETKFASSAVDIINLTEGIPPEHFKEVKARFKHPGIGGWDYTPYEAVNVGPKAKLAQNVFNGKEQIPLRKVVFEGFSIYSAPDRVCPPDKRKDLINAYAGTPEAAARLDGKFYSSSPMILDRLDREIHCLPWTKQTLFDLFPTAKKFRFLDLGHDHPTVCVWAALLPTNVWVVYRCFSQRGLTIDQRCEQIIRLSHNTRHKRYFGRMIEGPYQRNFVYEECHTLPDSEVYNATVGDYHIFKEDETTGLPFVLHYHQAGLPIIESSHIGPEDRAELTNNMLGPDDHIGHIVTKTSPGYRLYFLEKEYGVADMLTKLEDLFWDRFRSGPNKGEPKGTVPKLKDDELDALSYIPASGYRWTSFTPYAIMPSESEQENFTNQTTASGFGEGDRSAEDAITQEIARIAKEQNISMFGGQ